MRARGIKSFLINLLIILLLVVAIFYGFFASLGWITKHGEEVKVPNVIGLSSDAASQKISDENLKPIILDSVYYDSLPALSVVSQTPSGGDAVKDGRTVYITINRAIAPTTQMPDVKGYSLTSATLLLKSFGLKVGKYSYAANPVKDAVIKQQINDSDVAAGARIPMGTAIDLIIGDGTGNEMMTVPNILGMKLVDAKDYLSSMKCGIGSVTADRDVALADSGYIYRQSPSPVANDSTQATAKMKVGGLIDVWVKNGAGDNSQVNPNP